MAVAVELFCLHAFFGELLMVASLCAGQQHQSSQRKLCSSRGRTLYVSARYVTVGHEDSSLYEQTQLQVITGSAKLVNVELV